MAIFKDYVIFKSLLYSESPVNVHLGQIIENILRITAPPEAPKESLNLPSLPLKLVILGKRYSGKTCIAQQLSKFYSLNFIPVDEILKNAARQGFSHVQSLG